MPVLCQSECISPVPSIHNLIYIETRERFIRNSILSEFDSTTYDSNRFNLNARNHDVTTLRRQHRDHLVPRRGEPRPGDLHQLQFVLPGRPARRQDVGHRLEEEAGKDDAPVQAHEMCRRRHGNHSDHGQYDPGRIQSIDGGAHRRTR